MAIYLGNLSAERFTQYLGVEVDHDVIAELESFRQESANNIAVGKWHCFDMPFILVCGDEATAYRIQKLLAPWHDKMTSQLPVYWSGAGQKGGDMYE